MDTAERLIVMCVECRNVLAMIPPGTPNPFEETAIRTLRLIEKELCEVTEEIELFMTSTRCLKDLEEFEE